jgi:hypothetical protein
VGRGRFVGRWKKVQKMFVGRCRMLFLGMKRGVFAKKYDADNMCVAFFFDFSYCQLKKYL